MLQLKAKYLEARELPASPPYPASTLVTVLDGTDTLNLIGNESVLQELDQFEQLDEVLFELRWRKVDLASLGGSGKGKAYRLKINRVLGVAP